MSRDVLFVLWRLGDLDRVCIKSGHASELAGKALGLNAIRWIAVTNSG